MEAITFCLYVLSVFALFLLVRRCWEKLQIGNLEKRAVFITGCDSGFGHGLAVKCLMNGMPVFAGCLTEKGVENLKKETRFCEGKLHAFTMDVTSDESVESVRKLIEKEAEQFGGLFAIVNNAGIAGKSFYDDFLTMDDYRTTLEVNLFGVIRVTKSLGYMLRKTKGRIVNMASMCARLGLPGIGPYTISKHGVSAYSDVIRQELRSWEISVHVLEPGFFKTPLVSNEAMNSQLKKVWEGCPELTRTDYGREFHEQGGESTRLLLDKLCSPEVSWVVDTYFHALTARFPRRRYQIGWDHLFCFLPLSMLPAGIADYVFIALEKVVKAPTPAAVLKKKYQ